MGKLKVSRLVYGWMSFVYAAPSTTLPANAIALPNASSSLGPREEGASKIRSMPISRGLPAANCISSSA